MRVLLDECLPKPLLHDFAGHEVLTVPDAGWAGKSNGELLQLAQGHFDAFITVDQGIAYQQNLSGTSLVIIALRARSNRLADLQPLIPRVLEALANSSVGEYQVVE